MRRIARRSLRGARESPSVDQRCARAPCKATVGGARGLCTHCRSADMQTDGQEVQLERLAMRILK